MACRSSLELMLEKIQQLEDQPEPEDIPPALPVRPVSRARIPPARRIHFQKLSSDLSAPSFNGSFNGGCCTEKGIETLGKSVEKRSQIMIQKWYRGHRVRRSYKEIRTGAVALQSFVRGENARRKSVGAAVVVGENVNVRYDVLVDLQRRVVTTEARARQKEAANMALKVRIKEMEKKWELVEERMKSMEMTWQDQLLHIQKCLQAAAPKTQPRREIRFRKYNLDDDDTRSNGNGNGNGNGALVMDLPLMIGPCGCDDDIDDDDDSDVRKEDQINVLTLHPQEELCRLNYRFKAWKKDYAKQLREAQSAIRKLPRNSQPHKKHRWWGR
ncbi:myosin-3-like [Andrographis paniculata]|uniref:myosin-3-like n=1 Tax=Andrographis paniculata TaxID=175694 RepID=UPI0021E857CC|nr:myosin-3-like [Andrographis paniculata]